MNKFFKQTFILAVIISLAQSVFGQGISNYGKNHLLYPGTISYRVNEIDCNTNLTPTGTFFERTSWDSSPYTEGNLRYKFGDIHKMNYRLLPPTGYDSTYSEGYPMIVMLHGLGERADCWGNNCYYPGYKSGTRPVDCADTLAIDQRFKNNDQNLVHGGYPHLQAVNLAGTKKAEDPTLDPRAFPGFVLFPQNMNGWSGSDLNLASYIIYKLMDSLNIDPNRLYVHGLSNGGIGSWRIFQTNPSLFAAVLPMSGDFTAPSVADSTNNHPMWIFQGGKDLNPSPSQTASRIKKYEDAGGIIRYTEYPSLGHGTWNAAYAEPDFFSWMLKQNKANMHVYYGDSSFCSTDNKGVRLGVSQGFMAYQWRKDGVVLPDSTDRDIVVFESGTYEVRFSRISSTPIESEWNRWSDPVQIKERSADTPIISLTGSSVLPDLNGQDSVYLVGPAGFGTYDWYKNNILVTNPDTTLFKLSGTADAGNYSLIVKTLDGCPSLVSDSITVQSNAPISINTPQNFMAIPLSSTKIRLFWDDVSLDEQGFELYRTTTPGVNYSFVTLTNSDEISYTDTLLLPNTTYYYQIRGVSNTARSNYFSPEISVSTTIDQTSPTIPQNLVVVSNTVNSVDLSWDASNDNSGIQNYYVYYGSDSVASGGALNVTVPGLTMNSYFSFTVRAYDIAGNFSDLSNSADGNTIISGLKYEHSTSAWNSLTEIDWSFVEFSGDINNFSIAGTTQADFFNFKFDGFIFIPTDGDYTFYTSSDDGSRLYIDGFDPANLNTNLVVDNDGLHGTVERCNPTNVAGSCVSVNLTAGPHLITVLFFERTGGQNLQVSWEGPGISKELIPDSALKSGIVNPPDPAPIAPVNLLAVADGVVPAINLTWDFLGEEPENLDIVVLGSSTAFGNGASVIPDSTWVGRLDAWLTINSTGHNITNLALGGFDSYDIRATGSSPTPDVTRNITAALNLNPDIILINLPSNNVANNILISTTISHYKEIKALADAAGVKVYLTTTQPRNFGTNSVKRALLEEEADSVRANFGKFVIDIYDELTDFTNDRRIKSYYNADGIHVNDHGHRYIFNTVLSTLQEDLTNFQILRSSAMGGPYNQIGTTFSGNQSFTDTLLNSAATYYYITRTTNLNGSSGNSNEASAITVGDVSPPSDPINLSYHATSFTQISLLWDASVDNIGVAGYEIYRDNVLIDSASTSNYVASGLLPTSSYIFKVRAFDAVGNLSGDSNSINVSTGTTVIYYLQAGGAMTDLAFWDTAENGSDAIAPPNFSNSGQYFTITNQNPAILSSDWIVSGEVSKVVVSNNQNFDVNSNFTGTIEAMAGAIININSSATPSFENMDISSTVNFGSLNTVIPLASYGNLTLLGSSIIKNFATGETIINGDLISGSGVIIKGGPNNGSVIKIGGDVVINGLGLVPLDNRATLSFNGVTPQTLSTDGDLAFYELRVENGANGLLSGPPTAVITLGSLNGGGLLLKSGGSLDLSRSTLLLTSGGSINPMNETGQLGLDSTSVIFTTIPAGNSNLYPMPGKNKALSLSYNVPSNTQLVIQGDTLKIRNSIDIPQGVINSNGYIKLLSESDTTSAYVKNLSTGGQLLGNVTVQRHMNGEGKIWRYISSPVSGATVAQLQQRIPVTGSFTNASTGYSNNPSMFYYNETLGTGNEWVAFPSVDNLEVMVVGRGYSPFVREAIAATTFELTGTLNQGDIAYPTLSRGDAGNDGWNLLGNPYASPIKWDPANMAAWQMAGITNSVAVRDSGTGGTLYWDGTLGSLSNGIIAQGQSFWVQTSTAAPTLTITEEAKYNNLATTFYKTSGPRYIEIKLSDGANEDRAYLKFTTESSDGYDKNEDAFKRPNAYFNLSTLSQDSVALAINVVPNEFCEKRVLLNITDTDPGMYVLSFDLSNSQGLGEVYRLYDSYLGEDEVLSSASNYAFEITADTASFATRFSLAIERKPIDKSLVMSETVHCVGQVAGFVIEQSQVGVLYTIYYADSTTTVSFVGTGEDLSIVLAEDKLETGMNMLELKGSYPWCDIELVSLVSIERVGLLEVDPVESMLIVCQGEEGAVSFSSLPPGSKFRYYSDSTLTTFIEFTESYYTLPSTTENTTAYFTAVNTLGCEGEAVVVTVGVSNLEDPILSNSAGGLLSSYSGVNTWYRNDKLLEGIESNTYNPIETGSYYVSVEEGGCLKYSDTIDYFVTGLEGLSDALVVSIYPNPVQGNTFTIVGKELTETKQILILSTTGKSIDECDYQVLRNGNLQITIAHQLRAGLYYIRIELKERTIVKKFILKD